MSVYSNGIFELPSKGILYPEDSLLASGTVEIKPMTAKEENILADPNNRAKGVTYLTDQLMKSLIVGNISLDDLLTGDRNALMIYCRVMAWGKDLQFKRKHPKTGEESLVTVDLTQLKDKFLVEDPIAPRTNEFSFQLPYSGDEITYKLLTHGDYKVILDESEKMKTAYNGKAVDVTTRLRYTLLSVNGNREISNLYTYANNMISRDRWVFDKHVATTSPDIDMKADLVYEDGYTEEGVEVPFTVFDLFFPE